MKKIRWHQANGYKRGVFGMFIFTTFRVEGVYWIANINAVNGQFSDIIYVHAVIPKIPDRHESEQLAMDWCEEWLRDVLAFISGWE